MLDETPSPRVIHPLDRDRQIVRKSVDFVRSANTDAILPASLTARLNEDQIERLNALRSITRGKKESYLHYYRTMPMTTNVPKRQTVFLFGKPGLRSHRFGRVRGGEGLQRRRSNNDCPRECWWLRCQNSGRASAVEGVVACLRHPNGDDRTSYCETKKGRDATWDICKGQRNRDLDAAWKIGARFLAVKTGKELGAFNKEVPADRISDDTTPQPMLCEAVSAYRQQARAHS